MGMASKRATKVALACFLALFATPHFAGAQTADNPSSDYPASDYDASDASDASGDNATVPLNDIFDPALLPAAPAADYTSLGIPAQALDFAVTQAPVTPGSAAAGVQARIVTLDNHLDVHGDGSSTATTHIEVQLLSSQAVAALSQPALPYSDSLQDLQIKNAYTLKPDGTRLPVAPDAILIRQKAMPSPYFSDMKEKVILFPNVEPGDTLVYDSVSKSQPIIPGQFYIGFSISRALEIDNETLSFSTPKSFPLTFDSYGFTVQKGEDGENLTYTIHYSNRTPVLEQAQFLSEFDHGLRAFASSPGNFDTISAAYAPLVSSRIVVTPSIQAKANEITAGVTERREQARKLYEWVSTHVRYVALLFGDGGLVPHAADTVLSNGYGDCKDHAVLYSALLKAKGIVGNPVIINGLNGYFLPQVPQLLTFNHMIVWLPELGLYADTTSSTVPFGALPPFEYGKPVIRVGGSGAALQHVPLLAESASTYSSSSVLKLDDNGMLTATHSASATGALAGVIRAVANQAIAAGTASVAGAVLHARRLDYATGSLNFTPTQDLAPQYSYSSSYQFTRGIRTEVGFTPPEGLNLVNGYSTALLGPVADARYAGSEALPCFSGKMSDDYTIEFPSDKRLVSLPADGDVRSANIDYHSHWSLSGNVLSVHRELRAHFDKAVCTGATLRDTRAAVIGIQKDYLTRIAIAPVQGS